MGMTSGVSATLDRPALLPAPPPLVYDPNVKGKMTEDLRTALACYVGLVQSFSLQGQPPVARLEVSFFVDPNEGFNQLIVTHWLDASADAAMQYWADVDAAIESGLASVSPETAEVITDFVVTSVRWNTEGHAASFKPH